MTILIDHGERPSGVPAHLRCVGIDPDYRDLRVGDYIIEGSTVVERKAVPDLHRSLGSGRLWRQIAAMRATFDRRYPLVEGERLEDGPIRCSGIRGALLTVADSDIHVVRSRNLRDSAAWIASIATRASGKPRVRMRRRRASTPSSLLRMVPGISPAVATDLLARFGSIAAITQASDEDLLAVRGLGPSRITTLRRVFA